MAGRLGSWQNKHDSWQRGLDSWQSRFVAEQVHGRMERLRQRLIPIPGSLWQMGFMAEPTTKEANGRAEKGLKKLAVIEAE